ncbi:MULTISPECIES: hypothetical protein [Desulfosporosinus]|uniref:hypothetical protein n=1 Tax=Desulfosporosinus TaxID=79206 RepID=UPI001E507DBE|nr:MULTISPECIES: hypothetical protein [Desulfosporosinus]MCB8813987.1 hypothetical protein [Desulfosporosinus sp. SRJS8]MCO1601155.1 hypothetical protein [Desulfosporosinus nitroreducens]
MLTRAVLAPRNRSMVDTTLPNGFAPQHHALWAWGRRGQGTGEFDVDPLTRRHRIATSVHPRISVPRW